MLLGMHVLSISSISVVIVFLPVSGTPTSHKAFEICGLDYFVLVSHVEGRSTIKAWGLLFNCMTSHAMHVKIVTS